jgi:hypothetical protein
MITDLIATLETFAASLAPGDEKTLLEGWCKSARSGFTIRHNITHGVAMKFTNTLAYARNPRWHGEMRKREFGDFWADEPTLDLVREAMAVLLRIVTQLSREGVSLKEIASPLALKALRTARSVLGGSPVRITIQASKNTRRDAASPARVRCCRAPTEPHPDRL